VLVEPQENASAVDRSVDETRIGSVIEKFRGTTKQTTTADPRQLIRVLETLDRGRDDSDLSALVALLKEHELLPVEAGIYALRVAFRAGDHAACLREIEGILALSKQNAEALRTGGRIGNLTKDDPLALHCWERLADAAPLDQEAALQAARILLRLERHADSLARAIEAVAARQDKAEAYRIGVRAGLRIGWPEPCDDMLAGLFAVDPANAAPIAAQVAALPDAAVAARALSVAQARRPDNAALADIVDRTAGAWLIAGLENELTSRDADAAVYFNAVRRVRPANTDAKGAIERLNLPNLAAMRDAAADRDFAAAARHAIEATRIDPDCLEAWQIAGRSLFNSGDLPGAITAFRRCTELEPDNGRAWLAYGIALNQTDDRVGAYGAFRRASLLPSGGRGEAEAMIAALFPALIGNSGDAARAGRLDEAWRCFDAASEIRPGDPAIAAPLRELLRHTREALRRLWEAKSPDGIPLCRIVLRFTPRDRHTQTILARLLMIARDHAAALPVWEELSAGDTVNSHFHLQIARCCRALGLPERGFRAATEAYRLDPTLHEAAEIAKALTTA